MKFPYDAALSDRVDAPNGRPAAARVALRRSGPERYFFHLTNDSEVITDHDGVEMADSYLAQLYAEAVIEELRDEEPRCLEPWAGWRLVIMDEVGATVGICHLDSTSRINIAVH
jgi:hypothetical protein